MQTKSKTMRRYSPEFKINVILDMRDHHLGYNETAQKYWPGLTRLEAHNHIKSIHLWERIYLEEGAEGLMTEHRGRARGSGQGRPPKLSKSREEDLIAENQRLRTEIEYLKKLNALIQEKEESKKKTK